MARSHDKQLNVPGRGYTFVVTFLAVLIAGVTFDALSFRGSSMDREAETIRHRATRQSLSANVDRASSEVQTHSVSATTPSRQTSSARRRGSLGSLCLIAFVVGGLSLVFPREKRQAGVEDTASRIERLTGLPVLASLFPQSPSDRPRPRRLAGLLQTLVASCELVLLLAFFATIAGCVLRPTLVRDLSKHPLNGYQACVHELRHQTLDLWQTASGRSDELSDV